MITDPNTLYEKIAEKYDLTEDQVKQAIVYFWRSGVKRSLENIVSDEIYISKLGSFKIKDWKLKYAIPVSQSVLETDLKHEKTREYFSFLYNQLSAIDNKIKEKKFKKKEFKKNVKSHPGNIQEPPTDNGGVEKQADH